MTDTDKREDFRIIIPHEGAASLVVQAEDGRGLLAIHQDGTVTGAVEDASEAGARFVAYLRDHLVEQAHTPTDDRRIVNLRRVLETDYNGTTGRQWIADGLGGPLAKDILAIIEAPRRRTAVQEQGKTTKTEGED